MTFMIKTANGYRPWVAAIPVCDNHNQLHGVFRNIPQEQAQRENDERADRFCKLMVSGDMLAIKSFNEPIFGAYGERL